MSHRDMPSSLKGVYGEIVYLLEAKVSRSWRWPTRAERELNFVSKSPPSHHGQVMVGGGAQSKAACARQCYAQNMSSQ